MILANYAQQNRNCVREWGPVFTNPFSQFKPQLFHAFYTPDTAQSGRNKSSFNNGYNTHSAWHLAPKSGGLGSALNIIGTGTISASALAVKLAEADLTGDGTLAAIGGLIVQLVADIEGDGDITDANLQAFLAAVANLTGSGTISAATLTGLGAILSALTGSGTAGGSTATGIAALDADLVVTGTGLTTSNVGQAVWSALTSANNSPGTMGEALQDIPTATENADALLNRDMADVTVTNSRSPINALRVLRNKVTTTGGTLTITEEDDSTTAWSGTLTTDASADPITGVDPT